MEEIGRFNVIFLEKSLGNGRYKQQFIDSDTGELILTHIENVRRRSIKRTGIIKKPAAVYVRNDVLASMMALPDAALGKWFKALREVN